MKAPFYLIHCKKYKDRLASATAALRQVCPSFVVVSTWDADSIKSEHFLHNNNHFLEWRARAAKIRPILFANFLESSPLKRSWITNYSSTVGLEHFPEPPWLQPRILTNGEISVLLKHYFALSAIACGDCEWGLIAEDDIIADSQTHQRFMQCLSEFESIKMDYLDLAGGCGLLPEITDGTMNTQIVSPSRTRTNACYMVSRKFACTLVESFWPIVLPIDWHIQYLMQTNLTSVCYWASRPPFIHGSEAGIYKSWRTNV